MPTPASNHQPPSTPDDLWSSICLVAEQRQRPTRPKPARPTATSNPAAEAATERALLEALCGGMIHWTNDAQVFILHHWQCQSCGASGTFPNLDPRGRLVRRHNRAGTSWTCHDPSDDAGAIGQLPREFQHHHHPVGWCHNCITETHLQQPLTFHQFLPPTHISPGSATRMRHYV